MSNESQPSVIFDQTIDDLTPKPAGAGAAAPSGDAQSDPVAGLDNALNRRVWTWTSPFNPTVIVRFRRPRAGADELVAQMLGDQSGNDTLRRRYKALYSIIQIGEHERKSAGFPEPSTMAKLKAVRDRVGFVGPDDDDVLDEPINLFVFAYEAAMYPQQVEALAEVAESGLLPDDVKRIVDASGLERPKA